MEPARTVWGWIRLLVVLNLWPGATTAVLSAEPSQEAPYGGAAGRWHLRNPLPTSLTLRAVTSQSGLFVAVGDAGTVVTSTDATNWINQSSGVTNDLLAIVYGADRYVAVGNGGVILSSADAIGWQVERSPGTNALRGVAFGGGRFIAVGDAGTIVISTDASDWTERQVGATNVFNGVAFGHDIYVIVGERPGIPPPFGHGRQSVILISIDGIDWSTGDLRSGTESARDRPLSSVSTRVAGGFVAVGNLITAVSSTGVEWAVSSMESLGAVVEGDGQLVGAGNEIFEEWVKGIYPRVRLAR